MKTIDLNRVREALPSRAVVTLGKTDQSSPFIRIVVANPSLYDKGTKQEEQDIEMIRGWLRDIIGNENISEIYSDSTGTPWTIYLKRLPYEFLNASDEDVNSWAKMNIVRDGKLIKQ